MGETYYEVLGVDPDATREELTAAYRERALETHPDHNDAPDAADRFKLVTEAETVLSDAAERARYDRLGHDAYVRLSAMGSPRSASADSSSSSTSSTTDAAASASGASTTSETTSGGVNRSSERASAGEGTTAETRTDAGYGPKTGDGFGSRTGDGFGSRTSDGFGSRTGDGFGSRADARTESRRSHHARYRRRRQRRTESRRRRDGWPFAGDESSASSSYVGPESTDSLQEEDESAFRYAVHDWNEEIDLEGDARRLDRTTAVTVGCIAVSYPVLVYASLAPAFPLVVNAVVAACSLLLVGYLLTMPKIALPVFGGWSALVSVAAVSSLLDPFSIVGALGVAFFWVPLGYAIAVWWVLRP